MSTSAGQSSLAYIGSKITLISNYLIRYEGILFAINTQESTVALTKVRIFGTEGRTGPGMREFPPCSGVYKYVVFRGKDIKDLNVCQAQPILDDPAIVVVDNVPPGLPNGASRRLGVPNVPSSNMYYTSRNSSMRPNNPGGSPSMARGGGSFKSMDRGNYPYMPRRGFGYNGGFNRGREEGGGDMPPVGELTAQLNQAAKNEVSEAFDFEEANSKFDKSTIKPEVTAASGENAGASEKSNSQLPIVRPGYDKKASFFDNISCEALDRQNGLDSRVDREKQRQLDSQTFGSSATAAQQRGSRFRRVYRRPAAYRRPGMQTNNGGMFYGSGYPRVPFGGY